MEEQQHTEYDHLTELLNSLRDKGCTVRVDGDKLHVTPRRLLTASEITLIGAHKVELITMLNGAEPQPSEPAEGKSISCTEGGSGTPPVPQDGPGKPDPPEPPHYNVIADTTIRLDVIREQLGSLAEAIQLINDKTRRHLTIDELADSIDGVYPAGPNSLAWTCPIHPCAIATAVQKPDGGFVFTCEAGCGGAGIIAASPRLRPLAALQRSLKRPSRWYRR